MLSLVRMSVLPCSVNCCHVVVGTYVNVTYPVVLTVVMLSLVRMSVLPCSVNYCHIVIGTYVSVTL